MAIGLGVAPLTLPFHVMMHNNACGIDHDVDRIPGPQARDLTGDRLRASQDHIVSVNFHIDMGVVTFALDEHDPADPAIPSSPPLTEQSGFQTDRLRGNSNGHPLPDQACRLIRSDVGPPNSHVRATARYQPQADLREASMDRVNRPGEDSVVAGYYRVAFLLSAHGLASVRRSRLFGPIHGSPPSVVAAW
jgi:hypothetical protein